MLAAPRSIFQSQRRVAASVAREEPTQVQEPRRGRQIEAPQGPHWLPNPARELSRAIMTERDGPDDNRYRYLLNTPRHEQLSKHRA